MFTMGAAVQLVTDWAGDPAAVVDFQTRFTKPVPVADTTGTPEPGAVIEVSGAIGALDAEAGTARVDLTVVSAGQKVLVKAQAVVRLALSAYGRCCEPARRPGRRRSRHWRNAVVAAYAVSGLRSPAGCPGCRPSATAWT